ncbi:MAG: hypothetical protein V4438_00240 [Patescibacteria group bacterium]
MKKQKRKAQVFFSNSRIVQLLDKGKLPNSATVAIRSNRIGQIHLPVVKKMSDIVAGTRALTRNESGLCLIGHDLESWLQAGDKLEILAA